MVQFSDFAKSDEEAKQRYDIYRSKDPFPDIFPTLLNCSDVIAYIQETGMVHPFDANDPELRKVASIGIKMEGRIVYWDEDGKKHDFILAKDPLDEYPCRDKYKTKFTLQKNAIAFVTLQPRFRFPKYIAARFNLKISNVYRGLLLGTGPLVDPGFVGRLSIPLHNLTSNDYDFYAGERILWMEFTKLSPHPEWADKEKESTGDRYHLAKLPDFEDQSKYDVSDYLKEASPHRPVVSSIPEEVRNIDEIASVAKQEANKAKKYARTLTAIGFVAVAALIISGYQLVVATLDVSGSAYDRALNQAKAADEILRQDIDAKLKALKVEIVQELQSQKNVTEPSSEGVPSQPTPKPTAPN